MKANESRHIKIDLQIKKRKETLKSPSNINVKMQVPTTKSTNNSKKLNVTIHNKQEQQRSTHSTFALYDPKKIVVSEFKLNEIEPNRNIFPKNIDFSKSHIETESNKENNSYNPSFTMLSNRRLEDENTKQDRERKKIISLIGKKEAQIEFYQNLFEQKQIEHLEEEKKANELYEQYLQNLINIYQEQVEKSQRLAKIAEEKQLEKELQRKRELITLEGRMGLNFSPKQLSTFSGMSGGSILLQSIQQRLSGQLRQRRSSLFSFGSTSKLSKSQSVCKQSEFINFLNPGRAFLIKSKKILFD